MIPAEKSKADANPTKAFFVRMITRDITLEDCIFDLIDNSIDGAWELAGGHPLSLDDETDLSAYKISVLIREDGFEISDNCGGITLDDAADYAFTFGRKQDAETENFSIGVYGIGMKRAVFKVGSEIEIRSTYNDGDKLSSFRVPIDVEQWLASGDENWDFDIEEAEDLEHAGVQISVLKLTEGLSDPLKAPSLLETCGAP
jgi:DNA topoisomerase VI subunit B